MLLVMWTVAPNGWFRGVSRPAELPAGTARTNKKGPANQRTGILAIDHVETDDHGTCSLPRHTIRERID
ncbi:hypothetical protein [Paractinoplanes rishiriensis]|uniref:hypothetical protein n=1 Tax=Paractinoplanes rishiriensis TaxID=1050105 RepID=UPI0019404461|nr:hypothetical protein [Actinoplanes rishiriensis]